MDLKAAVAVAKQRIAEAFAAEAPRNIRLEGFLYDDHLMVWSLTLGFELSPPASQARASTVVRVAEPDKTVLSMGDP